MSRIVLQKAIKPQPASLALRRGGISRKSVFAWGAQRDQWVRCANERPPHAMAATSAFLSRFTSFFLRFSTFLSFQHYPLLTTPPPPHLLCFLCSTFTPSPLELSPQQYPLLTTPPPSHLLCFFCSLFTPSPLDLSPHHYPLLTTPPPSHLLCFLCSPFVPSPFEVSPQHCPCEWKGR